MSDCDCQTVTVIGLFHLHFVAISYFIRESEKHLLFFAHEPSQHVLHVMAVNEGCCQAEIAELTNSIRRGYSKEVI